MDSTIIWSILCCTLFLSSTEAEIFTAISDVEPLLETHKFIIHNIDDYLNKEENRLNILKQHLNHYKKEHEKAMEDIPNYLGNPINAFTLIKRLTKDLIYLERGIKMGAEYINNVSISQPDQKYPEDEDLIGAAQALTRLQEVYYLNVEDLSEGILNGVTYSTPMTASDCFEVGRALFDQKDFTNAIAWMKAALRKLHENNLDYPVEETDILEYIGYSYYEQGDGKKALEWTDKLLQLDPDHVRAKENITYYKKIIADTEEKLKRKKRGETGNDDEVDPEKKKDPDAYTQEIKSYEALCRGETDVPREIAQRLKCYYLTENHPFLRLAPIKAEQVYINPDIMVFHQVISDDEIEFIQNAAKPRLKRGGVVDPETGNKVKGDNRIAKSTFLKIEESPVIAKISQRVSDMTGLNMWSNFNGLQVANYGIGGHYDPHHDFIRKHDPLPLSEKSYGNRIATVLLYMSEVSQGGATVFTRIGLSVAPIKNGAIFWMNLHPSGEGDFDTMHASCPVLRGSKWVIIKLVYQGGQELIKPCNLEYQQETQ